MTMKSIGFSLILFFLSAHTFGQFKHLQNAGGDPVTEITDPTQMKQGNWNYFDSNNYNFRTENYKDNTVVSNVYKTPDKPVNVAGYKQKVITSFTQKPIKELAAKLSKIGNGEIIIMEDNTVFIHFYYDRIKSAATVDAVNTDDLKKYALQKTILFF